MKKYSRDTLGIEFETEFRSKCTTFSMHRFGKNLVTVATRREDLHEGTDFRYRGVRIDPTLRLDEKDNTNKFRKSLTFAALTDTLNRADVKVEFGIRTGNKVKGFQEPVLVIGFSTSELSDEWATVMKILSRHMDAIMSTGLDLYDRAIARFGAMGVPA